jgi:hypothetical protein
MHRVARPAALIATIALATSLAACSNSSNDSGQRNEQATQQSNYDKLVASDPAHTMAHSPTRDTINAWIDTWSKPGKLSYVYLQNADGKITGYYVLKGLPVSYCTSLTPNYKVITPEIPGDNNVPLQVPAPAIDGVYYSGGECNTYYGFDATTGAYLEYTAGLGINVLLYDQPLPPQKLGGAIALGPTNVSDGKPVR